MFSVLHIDSRGILSRRSYSEDGCSAASRTTPCFPQKDRIQYSQIRNSGTGNVKVKSAYELGRLNIWGWGVF